MSVEGSPSSAQGQHHVTEDPLRHRDPRAAGARGLSGVGLRGDVDVRALRSLGHSPAGRHWFSPLTARLMIVGESTRTHGG